ncbi:MAG TPA: tetratricopeptide repeat protein [Acidisarcina sp.]
MSLSLPLPLLSSSSGPAERRGFPAPARPYALFVLFAVLLMTAGSAPVFGIDPASAAAVHADLTYGRADDAIARLQPLTSKGSQDAEAHHLLCRVLFQEQRWEDAIDHCEQAVRLAPANSDYHMWLGRALGEKADRASILQAYKYGQRVRSEFEAAVNADPRNGSALADLGEFYTDAPSIVGGGLDKAEGVAARLESFDAERAHNLRGKVAEQRKDLAGAEAQFKAGLKVAGDPATGWTVLGSFYRRQGRWDDMMQAIHSAVALDRDHGVATEYSASLLIRTKREPQLAIQLLRQYLESKKQSEDAPAFQVHVRLGHLLEQQGDRQGAQREFEAARALAQEYRGLP